MRGEANVVGFSASLAWDATCDKLDICGLPVASVTQDEVVRRTIDRCQYPPPPHTPPLTIFSCNVDMVVKAARDPAFGRTLGSASLLTADGMPIVWLGRLLGGKYPERVTGADLLPAIASACARSGHSLFLLGAAEGVAAEAARRLQEKNPGLRIAGTLSPPMGFDRSESEVRAVIKTVRQAQPDVLFVALGAPRQERFIEAHADALGAKVLLGVGAAIDMAAGRVLRAPRFLQRVGAEWMWRVLGGPGRLARRYLVEDLLFVALAARAIAQRALRPRS